MGRFLGEGPSDTSEDGVAPGMVAAAGRREAMRSLSALGMVALAALGLGRGESVAAEKKTSNARAAGKNARGKPGPPGPQGPPGPPGTAPTITIVTRESAQQTTITNGVAGVQASCEPGELLTGGGAKPIGNIADGCQMQDSFALSERVWAVDIACLGSGTSGTYVGQARCLKIT